MRRFRFETATSQRLKSFLIAMLGVILLAPIHSNAFAQGRPETYSISIGKGSLEETLKQVEQATNFKVLYLANDVKGVTANPINLTDANISQIMKACMAGTKLSYDVDGKQVVIKQQPQSPAGAPRTVTGVVRDDKTGETIPGAYVISQKENKKMQAVITDPKGRFTLNVPAGADAISFSFVGYKPRLIPIEDVGSDNKLNVALQSEMHQIEDVVVTGVFDKPKESFTGAVTFISKEDLVEFKSANILSTIGNIDPAFAIAEQNEYGSDPNRMPEITIRGSSSLPMTVDDVQNNERANLNTPLFILDGFEITLERMMDLEQEEIGSVTILKDASSTALYGSRGANGVVVLTSVKPEEGKLKISASGGFNFEIPDLSSYNMMNASEKLRLEKEVGLYTPDSDATLDARVKLENEYNDKLKAILEGVDTYWMSQPLQVGIASNCRLSASGGNQAFRYSLSGSLNQVKGVMIGSGRTNFNGTANISYEMKQVQWSNIVSTGINSSSNSVYGEFSDYVSMNPYWRVRDEDGNLIRKYTDQILSSSVANPLYIAQLSGFDETGYNNIRYTTSLRWKPSESYQFMLRGGISTNVKESNFFKPAQHPDFDNTDDVNKKGSYKFGTGRTTSWDIALTNSYAKVIEKHRLTVGLDVNFRESNSYNYSFEVQGFTHERLNFLSMGSQYATDSPSGGESKGRTVGLTSDFNYNYDNIVYMSGSYRVDGASSFGTASRFRPFYSIGVGWTVSRMNFFADNIDFITNLRIRYNYGVTGMLQFSSPYQAMAVYNYDPSYKYNGELGAILQGLPNENLSWQMDYSHNLGADIAFLNGKISMGVNVYRKITEGLTATVQLPLTNGYTTYTGNKGDVLNEGYDFSVSYTILNNRAQKLRWSVRASVANNRNILLRLSEEMKEMSAQAEAYGREDPNYLYREGESMDALYVVPSLGIDPATGKEIYMDVNGNPTYNWSDAVRRNYGVTQPKIRSNFSTSVSYKNLRVTANFTVRYGAQQYNRTLMSRVEGADFTENVDKRVYELRWKQPGDNVSFVSIQEDYKSRQTSRFVQDDNSFAFSALNVNYRLPPKLVKKIPAVKTFNLTASINDIFYITSIKRERGTTYPYSIKPRLSLSMTF
ncbi:MAG: SusC/RagA family TonB-linked outer membrane protein [Mangrovibacterium sp.]